jgi:hypothetical protein
LGEVPDNGKLHQLTAQQGKCLTCPQGKKAPRPMGPGTGHVIHFIYFTGNQRTEHAPKDVFLCVFVTAD